MCVFNSREVHLPFSEKSFFLMDLMLIMLSDSASNGTVTHKWHIYNLKSLVLMNAALFTAISVIFKHKTLHIMIFFGFFGGFFWVLLCTEPLKGQTSKEKILYNFCFLNKVPACLWLSFRASVVLFNWLYRIKKVSELKKKKKKYLQFVFWDFICFISLLEHLPHIHL